MWQLCVAPQRPPSPSHEHVATESPPAPARRRSAAQRLPAEPERLAPGRGLQGDLPRGASGLQDRAPPRGEDRVMGDTPGQRLLLVADASPSGHMPPPRKASPAGEGDRPAEPSLPPQLKVRRSLARGAASVRPSTRRPCGCTAAPSRTPRSPGVGSAGAPGGGRAVGTRWSDWAWGPHPGPFPRHLTHEAAVGRPQVLPGGPATGTLGVLTTWRPAPPKGGHPGGSTSGHCDAFRDLTLEVTLRYCHRTLLVRSGSLHPDHGPGHGSQGLTDRGCSAPQPLPSPDAWLFRPGYVRPSIRPSSQPAGLGQDVLMASRRPLMVAPEHPPSPEASRRSPTLSSTELRTTAGCLHVSVCLCRRHRARARP